MNENLALRPGMVKHVYGTAPSAFPNDSLATCVGDAQNFLDEAWRKHPVLIRQASPDQYRSVIDLAEIEDIITGRLLRADQVRLAEDGNFVNKSNFSQWGEIARSPVAGVVRPSSVALSLGRGGTVVLDDLSHYTPSLGRLCRGVSRVLGFPTQASAYITPPGRKGFRPHEDRDHVILLQIEGRKHWHVGKPGEAHAIDAVLEPGDCLYIPSHVQHHAEALPGAMSVHVTLGITVPDVADALCDIITTHREALGLDAEFASVGGRGAAEEVRMALQELAGLADALTSETLMERISVDSWLDKYRTPVSLLESAFLQQVDGTTSLKLHDGAVIAIQCLSETTSKVRFGRKELRIPNAAAAALSAVSEDVFTMAEVFGETAHSAANTFASLLVSEGVARVHLAD